MSSARGLGAASRSHRLWAISCLFNAARYRNRLANYRTFVDRLPIPLVTVELSFGGAFELGRDDATILIQLGGGAVLWQKERLLNIAAAALPGECDAVAYLDADVVFERDDWPDRALAMLDDVPLVQPFTEYVELSHGADPAGFRRGVDAFSGGSLAAMVERGSRPQDLLSTCGSRLERACAGGFAWVARRSLVSRHRFYDACVIGSGNHAMVAAAYGVPELSIDSLRMTPPWARHYRAWADPYFEDVRGRVRCLDGAILHLWHGRLEDRAYRQRHQGFAAFGFNPEIDLGQNGDACWSWATDKPEMHEFVRRYFESRREDGDAPVDVRAIPVDDALEIRRAVLNPRKPREGCLYPQDLDRESVHFGAYCQNELVGVASLYHEAAPHANGRSCWRIRDMAVVERRQGQGVGTALVDACTAHAARQRGDTLWCYARQTAVGFYLARGFAATSEVQEVPGLGPRAVMSRRLPGAGSST